MERIIEYRYRGYMAWKEAGGIRSIIGTEFVLCASAKEFMIRVDCDMINRGNK